MFPCKLQEEPTRPTLSIRFRAPVHELPKHFTRVYTAIMQYLGELGEEHAGPAFAIYNNMDMENLDIEAGFPVTKPLPAKGEIQSGEIAAGTFAICHYTGPYDQVGSAYEQLARFAVRQGYAPSGAAYEWYLNSPEDIPPQELMTDLAFPVERVEDKQAV
jgi:effector-binding domain-containing protein